MLPLRGNELQRLLRSPHDFNRAKIALKCLSGLCSRVLTKLRLIDQLADATREICRVLV